MQSFCQFALEYPMHATLVNGDIQSMTGLLYRVTVATVIGQLLFSGPLIDFGTPQGGFRSLESLEITVKVAPSSLLEDSRNESSVKPKTNLIHIWFIPHIVLWSCCTFQTRCTGWVSHRSLAETTEILDSHLSHEATMWMQHRVTKTFSKIMTYTTSMQRETHILQTNRQTSYRRTHTHERGLTALVNYRTQEVREHLSSSTEERQTFCREKQILGTIQQTLKVKCVCLET